MWWKVKITWSNLCEVKIEEQVVFIICFAILKWLLWELVRVYFQYKSIAQFNFLISFTFLPNYFFCSKFFFYR